MLVIREAIEMQQNELIDRTGLHATTISAYENGLRLPRAKNLALVLEHLGATREHLDLVERVVDTIRRESLWLRDDEGRSPGGGEILAEPRAEYGASGLDEREVAKEDLVDALSRFIATSPELRGGRPPKPDDDA